MSEDLAYLIGGLVSCFGVGFALGRWVKSIRQFFDSL